MHLLSRREFKCYRNAVANEYSFSPVVVALEWVVFIAPGVNFRFSRCGGSLSACECRGAVLQRQRQ